MGIEKMHKIFVSMVTNMLPWQPKKGFLRTQKRSHSSTIPYKSIKTWYGGDGHRKNPQNIRFCGDQCVAMATKQGV